MAIPLLKCKSISYVCKKNFRYTFTKQSTLLKCKLNCSLLRSWKFTYFAFIDSYCIRLNYLAEQIIARAGQWPTWTRDNPIKMDWSSQANNTLTGKYRVKSAHRLRHDKLCDKNKYYHHILFAYAHVLKTAFLIYYFQHYRDFLIFFIGL